MYERCSQICNKIKNQCEKSNHKYTWLDYKEIPVNFVMDGDKEIICYVKFSVDFSSEVSISPEYYIKTNKEYLVRRKQTKNYVQTFYILIFV